MTIKAIAKKSSILNFLNANLKSFRLSQALKRLEYQYRKIADFTHFDYSPTNAISQFITSHQNLQPNFVAKPAGSLNVFWVGTMQDQDESGFLQCLNKIAKVSVFSNSTGGYGLLPETGLNAGRAKALNDEALIFQVIECNKIKKIDLLLGQMWAQLVSSEALASIRSMGIPIINIAMDDRLPLHWKKRNGVRMGSIGLSGSIDLVLTTSPETCLWYGVEGCPALYMPLASDPDTFAPESDAIRDIDVLFIGNKYGIREKIVSKIKKYGISIDCYGVGWPNGFVNAKKNICLSKRAKIILGIGTVGHSDKVMTLKLRDFDAIMAGALYITHRNPDLCELFAENVDFVCYESWKEAAIKIQYYLQNDDARQRIARSGQSKAISNHSWEIRLSTVFRRLGLIV